MTSSSKNCDLANTSATKSSSLLTTDESLCTCGVVYVSMKFIPLASSVKGKVVS